MIHTVGFSYTPSVYDDEMIRNEWKIAKRKEREKGQKVNLLDNKAINKSKDLFIYHYDVRDAHFTYDTKFNNLLVTVNVPELLGKDVVGRNDLPEFVKRYKEIFLHILPYTNPCGKLSRIDYKIDIVTEHASLIIQLWKKTYLKYKCKKQEVEYESSVYMKGKTSTTNIYLKDIEQKHKFEEGEIDEYCNKYDNMLRVEVQLKRKLFWYNLKKYGIEDTIDNYFDELSRDYYLNSNLKGILFNGDYYDIHNAEKKLQDFYGKNKKSKTTKIVDLIKLIDEVGVTAAQKKYRYSKDTFKDHMKNIQRAGVNPIIIPQDANVKFLKNPFNFTDSNIFTLEGWTGLRAL